MRWLVVLCCPRLEETHRLLEEISTNNCQWPSERSLVKKTMGIHEVNPVVNLSIHVVTLANQIEAFTTRDASTIGATMVATTSYTCEGVGVEQEQCQYIDNRNFNYRPQQFAYSLPFRLEEP